MSSCLKLCELAARRRNDTQYITSAHVQLEKHRTVPCIHVLLNDTREDSTVIAKCAERYKDQMHLAFHDMCNSEECASDWSRQSRQQRRTKKRSSVAEEQLVSDTSQAPQTHLALHPLNTAHCHDTCLCFLLMHETHRPVAPARSPQTHQTTVNAELLDNQPTPNTSRHFKQDQQTSRFIKNGSPNKMCSILLTSPMESIPIRNEPGGKN